MEVVFLYQAERTLSVPDATHYIDSARGFRHCGFKRSDDASFTSEAAVTVNDKPEFGSLQL